MLEAYKKYLLVGLLVHGDKPKASKVRNTDGSTLKIEFESNSIAFDGQHPIIGVVNINAT